MASDNSTPRTFRDSIYRGFGGTTPAEIPLGAGSCMLFMTYATGSATHGSIQNVGLFTVGRSDGTDTQLTMLFTNPTRHGNLVVRQSGNSLIFTSEWSSGVYGYFL